MLGALQAHDFQAAAHEMMESLWATEVPERAERLHVQMLTGAWV